jgi:hypothetical protein
LLYLVRDIDLLRLLDGLKKPSQVDAVVAGDGASLMAEPLPSVGSGRIVLSWPLYPVE